MHTLRGASINDTVTNDLLTSNRGVGPLPVAANGRNFDIGARCARSP